MAVRRFDESLAAGKSISIETTLTGHSALQRMERAKAADYEVSLIYVALRDAERNVRRVAACGGAREEHGTIKSRRGP
jgi:predicted ABC-type ATPase